MTLNSRMLVPHRSSALRMPCVSWLVAAALCMSATGCGDAVGRWASQLRADDVQLRRQAARELGRLGLEAIAAVPSLGAALEDDDADVRRLAAYALGEIGPQAVAAVPALSATLDDPQRSVRFAAAYAMLDIDPQNPAVVGVLAEALGSSDVRAVVALGATRGPAAEEAVPLLCESLGSRERLVRLKAVESLGQIGPAAVGATSALRDCLDDREPDVRAAAALAIERVESETPP